VKVGRIANFKNFSADMVSDSGLSGLGMEYFCFESDGLWSSPDAQLLDLGRRELVALGICRAEEVKAGMVYRQPKAYPVYDGAYLEHLEVVREWLTRALPNLWLIGRNGMHRYNNQDHSMMTGLLVARNIALGTAYDPWLVNIDAEYHEEQRESEGEIAADGRRAGRAEGGRQAPQRIAG
jgi:protoporphyrinogen oxidase